MLIYAISMQQNFRFVKMAKAKGYLDKHVNLCYYKGT